MHNSAYSARVAFDIFSCIIMHFHECIIIAFSTHIGLVTVKIRSNHIFEQLHVKLFLYCSSSCSNHLRTFNSCPQGQITASLHKSACTKPIKFRRVSTTGIWRRNSSGARCASQTVRCTTSCIVCMTSCIVLRHNTNFKCIVIYVIHLYIEYT